MNDTEPVSPGARQWRAADLVVLVLLAVVVSLYLYDAVRSSRALLHLILVAPLALAVLSLCAFQFLATITGHAMPPAAADEAAAEPVAAAALVIALFVTYVASLAWLGFDVGTSLFIGSFLWAHGERRLRWLLAYAIAFGFGLAWLFAALLPYEMPLLLIAASGR